MNKFSTEGKTMTKYFTQEWIEVMDRAGNMYGFFVRTQGGIVREVCNRDGYLYTELGS